MKDLQALPYAVSRSSTLSSLPNLDTESMKVNNLSGLVFADGAPAFLRCIVGLDKNPATKARSALFVSFLAMAFKIPTRTWVARLTQLAKKRESSSGVNSFFFLFSAKAFLSAKACSGYLNV